MAGYTTKDLQCVTLVLLFYFISSLTANESFAEDQIKVLEFDVMPGGVEHQQEETWDGVTCRFTYICQGGTKESWSFGMTRSSDLRQYSCSVERPGGNSYLFFLKFKLEVVGATVFDGQAFGNHNKPLGIKEYFVNKSQSLLESQEGNFNAELSRVLVYASTSKQEL